MIALYMDENVGQITDGLRPRGIDVLTVQEDRKELYSSLQNFIVFVLTVRSETRLRERLPRHLPHHPAWGCNPGLTHGRLLAELRVYLHSRDPSGLA